MAKKKSRKKPITPKSQIKNAIRQLWLRSRERAAALKRDNYTCQVCHRKQTMAKGREFKVQVHHVNGIDWDGIADIIKERVLQTPDSLITMCKECHGAEHAKEKP